MRELFDQLVATEWQEDFRVTLRLKLHISIKHEKRLEIPCDKLISGNTGAKINDLYWQ